MNTPSSDEPLPSPPTPGQLFDAGDPVESPSARTHHGAPRLRRAQRDQVVMRCLPLDAMLPEDHRARIVWDYVQGLDLTVLYNLIRAAEGRNGREATDPPTLLAVWLYATVEG